MSRLTSRATCQGTRTRGGSDVVDDEPALGGVVDDEWTLDATAVVDFVPRGVDLRCKK
jgi:hypothetical protein